MRRMIPQKQINKIDTLFQLFKLTPETLPPLPDVPNSLVFNRYIDDFNEGYTTGDYEVDYDQHVITTWYPIIEDSAGLAAIHLETIKNIPFPATIENTADLIAWININPMHLIAEQFEGGALHVESTDPMLPYCAIELDIGTPEIVGDKIVLHVLDYGYNNNYMRTLYITTMYGTTNFKLSNSGVLEATDSRNQIGGQFTGNVAFSMTSYPGYINWNADKSQGTFAVGWDLSKRVWEIVFRTHDGSERAIDLTILGQGDLFDNVMKFPSVTDGGYWQLNFGPAPFNENYTITISKHDDNGDLVPHTGDNTKLEIRFNN